MSFTVRNGPGIAVSGISPGDELRGSIPVLINASEAGIDSKFDAHSMETHRGIPFWAGGFAAIVILACAAYLATDPFRHRSFNEQAVEVAALLGRDLEPRPPIPIDAQPPEGSAAATLKKPPHPQNLVLGDGDFLEILPLRLRKRIQTVANLSLQRGVRVAMGLLQKEPFRKKSHWLMKVCIHGLPAKTGPTFIDSLSRSMMGGVTAHKWNLWQSHCPSRIDLTWRVSLSNSALHTHRAAIFRKRY